MLQGFVDGSVPEECLNKFSSMIQGRMQESGVRPVCDYCTEFATRELSKQTVVPFQDVHTMRETPPEFQRFGRPKLTFHDQIWSCCSPTYLTDCEKFYNGFLDNAPPGEQKIRYARKSTEALHCPVITEYSESFLKPYHDDYHEFRPHF